MDDPNFSADDGCTSSNPEVFNNCDCDAWPDGSPHRHLGAIRDVD